MPPRCASRGLYGSQGKDKSDILNTAGISEKAIIELSWLKSLIEQTYGQDETRYHAWSDIAMAEALLELEEYQARGVLPESLQ